MQRFKNKVRETKKNNKNNDNDLMNRDVKNDLLDKMIELEHNATFLKDYINFKELNLGQITLLGIPLNLTEYLADLIESIQQLRNKLEIKLKKGAFPSSDDELNFTHLNKEFNLCLSQVYLTVFAKNSIENYPSLIEIEKSKSELAKLTDNVNKLKYLAITLNNYAGENKEPKEILEKNIKLIQEINELNEKNIIFEILQSKLTYKEYKHKIQINQNAYEEYNNQYFKIVDEVKNKRDEELSKQVNEQKAKKINDKGKEKEKEKETEKEKGKEKGEETIEKPTKASTLLTKKTVTFGDNHFTKISPRTPTDYLGNYVKPATRQNTNVTPETEPKNTDEAGSDNNSFGPRSRS